MGGCGTALPQQGPCGPLGVARVAKLAAFQAVKISVRCEEAVSPLIPGDDSCSPVIYFDNVSFGHVSSFTGKTGAAVLFCNMAISNGAGSATGAGGRREATQRHARTCIDGGCVPDRLHALLSADQFTLPIVLTIMPASMK